MFARAGDGESFLVQQALDFENGLDVFAAVEAMAVGALHRLQHGKFGFPVAQDEGLGGRQAADFADAEEALLFRVVMGAVSGAGAALPSLCIVGRFPPCQPLQFRRGS